MATDYERLRAALKAERDEPGPIYRVEVDALLAAFPPPPPTNGGDFLDIDFDPTDFG